MFHKKITFEEISDVIFLAAYFSLDTADFLYYKALKIHENGFILITHYGVPPVDEGSFTGVQ